MNALFAPLLACSVRLILLIFNGTPFSWFGMSWIVDVSPESPGRTVTSDFRCCGAAGGGELSLMPSCAGSGLSGTRLNTSPLASVVTRPPTVTFTVWVPTLLAAGHESLVKSAWLHCAALFGLPIRPGGRLRTRSRIVSEPVRSNESVKSLFAPAFTSAGLALRFSILMSACAGAAARIARARASRRVRRGMGSRLSEGAVALLRLLLCQGWCVGHGVVDGADEVSFEAADRFGFGFAVVDASCDVGLGGLVAAQLGDR